MIKLYPSNIYPIFPDDPSLSLSLSYSLLDVSPLQGLALLCREVNGSASTHHPHIFKGKMVNLDYDTPGMCKEKWALRSQRMSSTWKICSLNLELPLLER